MTDYDTTWDRMAEKAQQLADMLATKDVGAVNPTKLADIKRMVRGLSEAERDALPEDFEEQCRRHFCWPKGL